MLAVKNLALVFASTIFAITYLENFSFAKYSFISSYAVPVAYHSAFCT